MKLVFIGAGSGFGAKSFVDLMSFPELRESEVVLVDVNPNHLEPVERYCKKVVESYNAPTIVTTARIRRLIRVSQEAGLVRASRGS